MGLQVAQWLRGAWGGIVVKGVLVGVVVKGGLGA